MIEGYWINYGSNFKIVSVGDHEVWIRNLANAKKIGLAANVHVMAANIKDREKYLVFLLQHSTLMRVRGHGIEMVFQFATHSRQDAMDAILIFGKRNAGPSTWMVIDNFATKENTQMNFEQFEQAMDTNGAEGVLRVAGKTSSFNIPAKIVRELLAMSKQLVSQA